MNEEQLAVEEFLKRRALGQTNIPSSTYEAEDDKMSFTPTANDPLLDIGRGIVRGPIEALKNATVNISDWFGIEGTEEEVSPFFSGLLKKIDKPTTTAGQLTETASAFISSYGALRGIGGTSFKAATARGAAVDFLIWDEEDGRIADVLSDAGVQNVVVDYLKHNDDDSKFEDGLKNAIEGAAAGVVSEALIKTIVQGYKLTKAKFSTTGEAIRENEPIMPLKEITPEPTKEPLQTDIPEVKPQATINAEPTTSFTVSERKQGESGNDYINRLFTENNVTPEDQKQFFKFSANENFMTDALPKFKKFMDSKPYRTEVDYTRGEYQFHGTSGEITTLKDVESSMTETNIYGDGFYTTNKADVASSYTKKGQGTTPSVYKVEEVAPVKNLDLEQTKASDVNVDWEEYAIDSSVSLREAIDELRANTKSYEFMEILDTLRRDFQKQGYGSWSHRGGEQTASQGHFVQIYFNPEKDIKLTKITEEDVAINKEAFNKARREAISNVQGVKPPDTAFNYERVEGIDDEARAILEATVNNKDLSDFLSIGVRPQAVTEQMVEVLDKKVGGDYLKFADELIKDTKDYDVKLVYMKQKMYDKLIEVQTLTKEMNVDDAVDNVKLLQAWRELTILTGAAKAAQTGAARATAAGRINLVPKEIMDSVQELAINEPNLLNKELGRFIDKATMAKIHKQIFAAVDIDNDVTLHKAMNALNKEDGPITKLASALVEMRSAGLLSSPVTLGINIIGNTLVRGLARVEDYMAYGIGKAGSVFSTRDRIMWDELQAMSNGRFRSAMETFSSIGNVIKKGGPIKDIEDNLENSYLDFYQKYDTAAVKSISSDYLMNLSEESGTIAKGIGKTIDVAGAALRVPFHALGVTDDMFKRSIYSGQMSYVATREANKLKLTGEAKDKFISEMTYAHDLVFNKKKRDFTPEQEVLVNKYVVKNEGKFHTEVIETARELTFQEEIRSGKGASRINKTLSYIDNIRNLHPIGNFIVPFYVTPVNLLKWVGRRTPGVHLLSRRMTDDLKAGGRRADVARARLAMGTSLYTMGGMMAAGGVLIGGSQSEEERKSRAAAGLSDYSIKIGDETIEINRFDPLVTPLMLSADLYTMHREMVDRGYGDLEGYQEKFDEVAGTLITSFTNNVLNKTWLKSVSDIVDAVKYGNANYAKQALASFAPYSSAARFVNQQEMYKEANTVLDNFKKIYAPYLLKDKLDVFGKAYKDDRVAGIKKSEITQSPVRIEIARLKVPISKFDKNIEIKGAKIELEPDEHYKLQSYVNTVFKLEDRLNNIINSGAYQRLPDGVDFNQKGTKKWMIQQAITNTREKARKYYLSKNKATVDKLYKDYQEKVGSVNNKRSQLEEWLKRND